jgi:hypothetical protein
MCYKKKEVMAVDYLNRRVLEIQAREKAENIKRRNRENIPSSVNIRSRLL